MERLQELQVLRDALDSVKDINDCVLVLNRFGDVVGGLLDAGNRMALSLGQDPDAEPLPPVKQFFDQVGVSLDMVREFQDALRLIGMNIDKLIATMKQFLPVIQ